MALLNVCNSRPLPVLLLMRAASPHKQHAPRLTADDQNRGEPTRHKAWQSTGVCPEAGRSSGLQLNYLP